MNILGIELTDIFKFKCVECKSKFNKLNAYDCSCGEEDICEDCYYRHHERHDNGMVDFNLIGEEKYA